jgi:VWFA-related protein
VEHSGKPKSTPSPASAGLLPELPPDTVRSVPTPVDSLPLNIVLLDLLNTSPDAQAFARSQLIKLLQKKPAGMRLALFVLSDRLHLVQGFTDSDADLVAAANGKHADTYLSSFLGPSHDALTPVETLARGGLPPGANLEGLLAMDSQQQDLYLYHRVEMTIEAFLQIAHFVGGTPGRKNLIWISAAFPVVFMSAADPFSSTVRYGPRLKEATNELTLSQVAVYPVDARGLDSVSPLSAANTHNYKERAEGTFVGALDQAFLTRATEFQIMDKIAQDSCGHAFYNTNGLEYAMETALADGSTYYTISYTPTNTKFDGSLRHIRVALESNGVRQLSYRRTYLADDPDILRQRVEKTPFGRLDAPMQRGAPCAHEISFTAHMASEGLPEPANHQQIRQFSYFAAFAGNKNWNGVNVQRLEIEYSVFADQLRPVGGPDGARHTNLDFVAAAYDAEVAPCQGNCRPCKRS